MLHQNPFIKNIENCLRMDCAVQAGERLMLAVSGGADSIALMLAIHTLSNRNHWQLDLHLMHLNHHLRPSADRDELFTAELADKLEIPFVVKHVYPDQIPGNLESNARMLRRAHFALAQKSLDLDGVLLAHHADDQLETMMMRLIRGAGVAGLSAMSFRQTHQHVPVDRVTEIIHADQSELPLTLLRPMLRTTHADAVSFLQSVQQPWCEDETNLDTNYTRAKLRQQVLPILKQIKADASIKAMETSENLADLASWLQKRTRLTYDAYATVSHHHISMPREPLKKLPDIERTELLRFTLTQFNVSTDRTPRRVLRDISAAVISQSGEIKRFQLSDNIDIIIKPGSIHFHQ